MPAALGAQGHRHPGQGGCSPAGLPSLPRSSSRSPLAGLPRRTRRCCLQRGLRTLAHRGLGGPSRPQRGLARGLTPRSPGSPDPRDSRIPGAPGAPRFPDPRDPRESQRVPGAPGAPRTPPPSGRRALCSGTLNWLRGPVTSRGGTFPIGCRGGRAPPAAGGDWRAWFRPLIGCLLLPFPLRRESLPVPSRGRASRDPRRERRGPPACSQSRRARLPPFKAGGRGGQW